MGFDHRKLLLESNLPEVVFCSPFCNPILNKDGYCFGSCFPTCPDVCTKLIINGSYELPPAFVSNPPPPPPPPPPPQTAKSDIYHPPSNQKQLVESSMMITAGMIGAALLLVILFSIFRCIRRRNESRRRRRRRASGVVFDTQQDFLDEDHGPVLDHPIWYIHTVGLPQSVIDSITVCKFRKEEALIDGTDCSVCLSEFEEDEDLRLLPKCSHAFHIPCIDTWLRSHKNCPLCRAPIVCATAQVSVPEPNLSGSGSRDSVQNVESVESGGGVESLGSGSGEVGVAVDENVFAVPMEESSVESSRKVLSNSIVPVGGCDPRALSDLADDRRATQEDIQPMRRSVSMDSLSALRLYRDVASVIPEEGSSNAQLVRVKSPNSGVVNTKHGSASSGLSKLIRSSSIGFSLQMGPISMKRPFLSSRKLFSSKHGRSLSSVLPL